VVYIYQLNDVNLHTHKKKTFVFLLFSKKKVEPENYNAQIIIFRMNFSPQETDVGSNLNFVTYFMNKY
jgi:hypothetical protein